MTLKRFIDLNIFIFNRIVSLYKAINSVQLFYMFKGLPISLIAMFNQMRIIILVWQIIRWFLVF